MTMVNSELPRCARAPVQSFRMAVALPPAADDVLRLLVLVAIGGGLLALGRWSSRLGGNPGGDSPPNAPRPDVKELQPDDEPAPQVWPPGAEEVAASFPFDPLLGNREGHEFHSCPTGAPKRAEIAIEAVGRRLKEAAGETDAAATGDARIPSAPNKVTTAVRWARFKSRNSFSRRLMPFPVPTTQTCSPTKLQLQLYDPDSDHGWWQSYFVATPQGLAGILREKSWRYLYAPEMIVVPRYDLEEIRRAVASRIMADQEFFKDKEPEEEAPSVRSGYGAVREFLAGSVPPQANMGSFDCSGVREADEIPRLRSGFRLRPPASLNGRGAR